jgi:16S rRNA (uracil1498-N3)-methyltransferase
MDWLRIDHTPKAGLPLTLTGDTLRHALALRLREGEAVGLLDGRGGRAEGRVVTATRTTCVVSVRLVEDVAPPVDLTIAIGVLDNRDRMEFAIEKCTELGVRRIVLLDCQRSQRHTIRMERLLQKAEAAMIQSGRAWMPELIGPISVHTCLDTFPDATVIVGDQYGSTPSSCSVPALILVGPEGGFASEEQAHIATRNPVMWRIGDNRLRSETAAIVLIAAAVMA